MGRSVRDCDCRLGLSMADSRDIIRRQARRAAEADYKAGCNPDCPYIKGSSEAKRWFAEYHTRQCELEGERERVDEGEATRV